MSVARATLWGVVGRALRANALIEFLAEVGRVVNHGAYERLCAGQRTLFAPEGRAMGLKVALCQICGRAGQVRRWTAGHRDGGKWTGSPDRSDPPLRSASKRRPERSMAATIAIVPIKINNPMWPP